MPTAYPLSRSPYISLFSISNRCQYAGSVRPHVSKIKGSPCIFICNLSPYNVYWWQSVPIYFVLAICPHICIGNLSPYTFYWQGVPIYFLLARCPHILFIGKVSPYTFYWQGVPIYFLLARCPHILFIGKVSP